MSLLPQVPEHWQPSTLPTNDGSQPALLFQHPLRDAGFPNFYLLPETHPLRPPNFLPSPTSNRTSFKDYVVTIRKDLEFMERWQETGANTSTPSGDISLNLKNGVSLSSLPDLFNLT